ncbi:MAG TPA: hypothetical protein VGZ23_07140 [bacterium]|nr:hypothetical protein [bacterium]
MMAHGDASPRPVRVEVIAYAPTAFYHCQHCEVAFDEAGLGRPIRDEQLPDDLLHEYQAMSDWVRVDRYAWSGVAGVGVPKMSGSAARERRGPNGRSFS